MISRWFRAILVVLVIIFSCKKTDDSNIPNVYVNLTLDVTSTLYTELNSVGGWVYLTGGYRGILVYRLSMEEFKAYERCCPYDLEKPTAYVEVESSGITAVDSTCMSRFILTDGSVFKGPSKKSLKEYRTSFDGQYLRIFN